MKFYLYDETTKEYIGDQIGYIDPLETELKGENVYIIPPYSTDIEPNLSELKDNEIFVFNGSNWEIQKEFFIGKVVKDQSEKVIKFCNDNGYILEQVENGFKICAPTPKEKSLEELREQKLKELSSKASCFERTENKDMFIASSLGFRVNADPKAKRNIDTLVELQVQTFRDYDNVTHTDITVQDLETIKREISLNAVNLYKQKWAYADKIKSCETVDELDRLDFTFTMLDFSAE